MHKDLYFKKKVALYKRFLNSNNVQFVLYGLTHSQKVWLKQIYIERGVEQTRESSQFK